MSQFKILLISLHKIGDNLQSAASLPVLAHNHPGAQITVLSESPFDYPFRNHPNVKELVLFDRKIFPPGATESISFLAKNSHPVLQKLKEERFNLIVNRHSSQEGAAIAGFIGADEIRGYFFKEDGSGWVLDPWSRLLFSACRNRSVNPFNFVDYSINIAGPWAFRRALSLNFERGAAEKCFSEIGGAGPVVAVQVASNAERRQWGAERFGLAVGKVLSSVPDIRFAFIGTEGERKFVSGALLQIPQIYSSRVFDLSGKVSMEALPDFLQRCSFLLTNDTGPMHIAAAVNCPVIAIYAGESFLNETGPYAPDNWIVHADIDCLPCLTNVPCSRDFICKRMVTPDAVADYMISRLKNENDLRPYEGVSLYHSGTRFLKEEIRYRPLLQRAFTQNDFLRYAFYATFKEGLNGIKSDLPVLANEIMTSWSGIKSTLSGLSDYSLTFVEQFAFSKDERTNLVGIMQKNVTELRKLLS